MNIQEYSKLMGYEQPCADEEFLAALEVYMAAGEMTKEEFCRHYAAIRGNAIVAELTATVNRQREEISRLDVAAENAQELKQEVGEQIMEIANFVELRGLNDSCDDLFELAVCLLPEKTVLQFKLEKNIRLNSRNRELLLQLLKEQD
ncbi:MAG: hypothetical protein HDS14_06485 [Bacteroides sp.]|nr:hypothetical protein [Bacteroides sp.]